MLGIIKIKNFCSVKDSIKRMRRQARTWEKIYAKDTDDEELFSKIYKEHFKFNNKKTNSSTKKWAKILKDTSTDGKYTYEKMLWHCLSSGKCKLK